MIPRRSRHPAADAGLVEGLDRPQDRGGQVRQCRQGLADHQASYLLIDNATGATVAMMDGTELTRRRTAAASALAADYLARQGCQHHDAGRRRRAWRRISSAPMPRSGRSSGLRSSTARRRRRRALAAELAQRGLRRQRRSSDLEAGRAPGRHRLLRHHSTAPIVKGAWLKPGTHVDLAGAFKPTMRETDGEAVARAPGLCRYARRRAGRSRRSDPGPRRGQVRFRRRSKAISSISAAARCKGRRIADEITLFKSCGTAIEDLAAAIMVYSQKAGYDRHARNPICVALDTPDLGRAAPCARALKPHAGYLKIGMEFFYAHGAAGYEAVAARGPADLPRSQAPRHSQYGRLGDAVADAARPVPAIVNVHATGGHDMMKAARDAVDGRAKLIAVTILTSLSDDDIWAAGFETAKDTQAHARALAELAQGAGLDGVVCSPHDMVGIKHATGRGFPHRRARHPPADAAAQDQKRVATPEAAMAAGADILVIGRAITGAADPAHAAQDILASSMPVEVKICGLSTPETVDAALDAGADLVGLRFYPKSPRYVSLETGGRACQPRARQGEDRRPDGRCR